MSVSRYLLYSFVVCCPGISAFAQMSEPYVVRDSVTDCVNVRSDHVVTASEVGCLGAGVAVTVTDAVPYWPEIHGDMGREFGFNTLSWWNTEDDANWVMRMHKERNIRYKCDQDTRTNRETAFTFWTTP